METAALRSRLVSRLTGLSTHQLQYWHKTLLQSAHRREGSRGVPRLYSWLDYQRLCIGASLLEQRVPTHRIRVALQYLDDIYPEWFRLSLASWAGSTHIPGAGGARHVAVKERAFEVLADAAGQMSYVEAIGNAWQSELSEALTTSFESVSERGSLFKLHGFSDAVQMNPDVNVGLPTVVGSRLETSFVANLVKLSSEREVASLYGLDGRVIGRAVCFEELAA